MIPRLHLLFLLSLASTTVFAEIVYTNQYCEWYPQYRVIFEHIKNTHCTTEYEHYLTGNKSLVPVDPIGGSGRTSVLTYPVVNCILTHTSDYVKNGMTSAQVLLGVMPTILAVLGASSEEMSMLANVARRPILALLLSAGSPSVYFSRAFEYHDAGEILQDHPSRLPQWRPSKWYSLFGISLVEYAIALTAVGNIVIMNWELGVRTTCNFWTAGVMAPTIWAFMGIVTHFLGTFVLRLRLRGWRGSDGQRVRRYAEDKLRLERERMLRAREGGRGGYGGYSYQDAGGEKGVGVRATTGRVLGAIVHAPMRFYQLLARTEFVPSAAAGYDVRIVTFMERKTFLVAAWALSMWTVFHVIYGTLVFASTTFIGLQDSLIIMARYIASVACCRIVLMYELAGLRESCIRPIVAITSRHPGVGADEPGDSMDMALPVSTSREEVRLKDGT